MEIKEHTERQESVKKQMSKPMFTERDTLVVVQHLESSENGLSYYTKHT